MGNKESGAICFSSCLRDSCAWSLLPRWVVFVRGRSALLSEWVGSVCLAAGLFEIKARQPWLRGWALRIVHDTRHLVLRCFIAHGHGWITLELLSWRQMDKQSHKMTVRFKKEITSNHRTNFKLILLSDCCWKKTKYQDIAHNVYISFYWQILARLGRAMLLQMQQSFDFFQRKLIMDSARNSIRSCRNQCLWNNLCLPNYAAALQAPTEI